MYVCPKCFEENPRLGAQCPRDGAYFIHRSALEDASQDPILGTLAADKYIITSLISEGGMGAVYRALQMPVEREVAFKVLRTELQDSDKGRERFVQEARAISRLSHPNIITLYDFGFDKTTTHPYMVMEYAPGVSLARWVQTPQLTTERILHVAAQILAALGEAHRQGVIHRDLKPDNMIIMRTGDGQDFAKLLDFGIARLINERATRGLTREGEVFGTPHYMAPEQAQGKKNVGPPADVYAMGIMLYEMLCGDAPFDATSPLAVLYMHISDPLPPITPRPGLTVSKAVEDVIIRATLKKPEERFADASQMLLALQQAMAQPAGYTPAAAMASPAVAGPAGVSAPDVFETEQEAIHSPTLISDPTLAPPAETPTETSAETPEEAPIAVNLGQFAPIDSPNRATLLTDPAAEVHTLPGDLSTERPARRPILLLASIALVLLLGAVIVVLMSSSSKDASPENAQNQATAAQEPTERTGTVSAVVEIPLIDLKTDPAEPEPEKLADPAEPATIQAETPEPVAQPSEPSTSPKEKTAAIKATDSKKSTANTRTRTQTAAKRTSSQDTVVPEKFAPPKFQAPDDIPVKFERPE